MRDALRASHCSHTVRLASDVKNRLSHAVVRLVFVIAALVAFPEPSFAQVKVIISGGFSAAYREVVPEFERATGITVTTGSGASQGKGPNTIGAQLGRGVPADVVIMSREGLTELIAAGRIVVGTDLDLAQTPLGMGVRAGSPKPDISTVERFTYAVLHAKGVALAGSTTGIYLTTEVFPRLGIASKIALKTTARAVEAAALVAAGNAELVLLPVSEVLQAPGVDFVGAIPADVQYISVFSAAVVAGSKEPEASKRLIAFLSSEAATAAIKRSGMEPARRR